MGAVFESHMVLLEGCFPIEIGGGGGAPIGAEVWKGRGRGSEGK